MSNTQLKTVAGSAVAVQEQDPKTFPGMLVAFKAQIAAALPKHLNADRMARIALTCFRLNPGLAKCEPASVFAAVVQASQLGLEPGLNGRAYLIPYGRECQFIPGWRGLVELANRTGRASVWTGAVFQGDEFGYELGDDPHVHHRPGTEDDPDKLIYVYAVGRVRGNEYPVIEVWPIEKVRKHFKRYNKVGEKHYAHNNWEMYARKVVLLQVLKYMPASPELEAAISLNYAGDAGAQNLTIKDAIDGTFAPLPPENGNGEQTSTAPTTETAIPVGTRQGAAPTHDDIAAAIDNAQTASDLDLCADLVRSHKDDAERGQLALRLDKHRDELAAKRKA